ncbi:DUF6155 family protein [Roseimarinus sediminis]|jgi:hypothetical protein|uniref:DUF6155 family protein n=1 Tax=Roseimarinus sediminis TaxID=1610899 RepID=UPI003D217108
MPTKNLKKILNTLTKEQLVKHIIELDKKFKPVQEYHLVFVNNDVDGVLATYKKQIENEFYPARGEPKMRLSVARKAVSEAKKLGLPDEAMADLMLFYVETGVEFTNDYGDINESFYSSMETMYLRALELMEKAGILADFENRARKIVDNTLDIGWGFHDTLGDYFFQFY